MTVRKDAMASASSFEKRNLFVHDAVEGPMAQFVDMPQFT